MRVSKCVQAISFCSLDPIPKAQKKTHTLRYEFLFWKGVVQGQNNPSMLDIATTSASSSKDNFTYSLKVRSSLCPDTLIIWGMVYFWERYILVIPLLRAVWVEINFPLVFSTLP